MKEAKDWITAISDAGDGHVCNCICERCKNGRETFLLEGDLVQIQINALQWALHQTTDGIQRKIASLVKLNAQVVAPPPQDSDSK